MSDPVCRSLIWSAILLGIALAPGGSGKASENTVGAREHRTEAGHVLHYALIPKAKEVAITLTWPLPWIETGGPIATPYLGSMLMLNGGAGKRDAAALAADFQDLNASGNIQASADGMFGTLIASPDALAKAAEIGRDILARPLLDERWKKRLQKNFKADQVKAQRLLSNESWDVARRFILGNGRLNDFLTLRPASLIDEVTLDDIRSWHAETFKSDALTIAAAGPVDRDLVAGAIDRLLDDLPAGDAASQPVTASTEPAAHFDGKTILRHRPGGKKTIVSVIGLMPPTQEPGQLLDLFASLVLGGDRQSRLFDAIRTRLRATYGVGAGISNYDRQTRVIYLGGEVDGQRLEDAYAALRDAYEALRTEGLTTEEFTRTKDALIAKFSDVRKQPEAMARILTELLIYGDPLIERASEIPELIETFTLDQVNEAARERLPAFDNMVRIITTSDRYAIDADCIIYSVAEVDKCREEVFETKNSSAD